MLLSCLMLTLTLWGWAWQRHEVHTYLVAWPFELWSLLAFVEAFMSSTVKGRKWALGAALLLFFSIQAVQSWQVVMPHAHWLAAGMPTKPVLADLSSIVADQIFRAMSLSWVAGCSQLPWYAWAVGAPFCMASLLINSTHPVMPTWARYVSGAALVCWVCTLLLLFSTFLIDDIKGSPFWFWGLLVVVLPLRYENSSPWFLAPTWLFCLVGLVATSLNPFVQITLVLDAAFALAMGLTVISWMAWYVRMDAIQGFDLLKHLDSPSALEGADKYTRE